MIVKDARLAGCPRVEGGREGTALLHGGRAIVVLPVESVRADLFQLADRGNKRHNELSSDFESRRCQSQGSASPMGSPWS